MERSTPSGGYKDCEKGVFPEAEDNSTSIISKVTRQFGMWSVQAKYCCLLVAATVLISHSTLCGTVSSLHSRPLRPHQTLLSSRSASNIEARASELLNVAAIEPLASAGCSSARNVSIDTTQEVKLGDRSYRLYFPVNYRQKKPAPLILSYHGGSRTAKWQEELDLLTTTYFNKDYIVVYPQGINETWQGIPGVQTDDVGFTAQILDELEASYCVDTNRIYATGKSQGAGFVGVLACDATLSKRMAAFAPVSGAFYISNYVDTCEPTTVAIEPCNPGRTNIPILEFHGMNDTTIAYMGGTRRGACLPSIPHWIQRWAERDGLGTTNTSSSVPGAQSGSSAVVYEFGQGWQRGLVTHIMSGTNIGHDWPSTNANHDNLARDGPATFNASSIILSYFATHPLGWSF